jgi:CheY-like chemotaxis protein
VIPDTISESKEPVIADKILLVDDNQINLKILSAYMGKLSRAYVAVVNGKEARDAYVENPGSFIAILMDISMPVMDGLEATRQIRNHERQNQLPPVAILALTGLASHTTQKEALESGVDVYLTKPVRLAALTEALELMKIFP